MKTFNDDARLQNFPAWSGAEETKAAILAANKGAEFEGLIEELYPEGIGETALNGILRFESDWVFESLGLDREPGGRSPCKRTKN